MAKEERFSGKTSKLVIAFVCMCLLLFSLPSSITSMYSFAQPATTPANQVTTSLNENLIPSSTAVTREFVYPMGHFEGESVMELGQTVTWYPDGKTVVSDSRGYSYSISIPASQGIAITLLQNTTTVVHQVIGTDLQYGIYWSPVKNSDGFVDRYKFIIAGTSITNDSTISLNINGQYLQASGNKFFVTQPETAVARAADLTSLDPSFNWTALPDVEAVTNLINSTSTLDQIPEQKSLDGLGLDWSDAIAAGYEMNYDSKTSMLTVKVGKEFYIDPWTVVTVTTNASPDKANYYEGERRVTQVNGILFAFYYDGSNIRYKSSSDNGVIWSASSSVGTGTLASDATRWTIVSTSVSGTNYIAVLYFTPAGSNMNFYSQRGTVSGSSISWSGPQLLGFTAANAGCGSGSACAAASAATDTSGNIFAAFRWLSGGASTYSYRILYSADGGLSWTFLFSQVDGVSGTRPVLTLTRLSSGNMLFAYALYNSNEIAYRKLTGTSSWTDPPLTTSGSGMTTSTIKQISSDSNNSNIPYVTYLTGGISGTVKVAKWTSSGTFSGFETADSTLSHSLPSITKSSAGNMHVLTISGTTVYDIWRDSTAWHKPAKTFGSSFNSPNSLTSGISVPVGLWREGTASPFSIRFQSNQLTLDQGFGCGYRNWGVSYDQDDNPPLPVFGKGTDCATVLATLAGRSNFVQLYAKNDPALGPEPYEAAMQGCSPWYTCDIAPTPPGGNTRAAQNSNANFPLGTDTSCSTSCNLPADLQYRMQNQFLWTADSVSKPVNSGANVKGHVLTNIWFVDVNSGKTADGNWKNILVLDLPNTVLQNNAGTWAYESHAIGSQDSSPHYNVAPNGQTSFHISIVIGSGSSSGTWYDTGTVSLYQYIQTAFTTSYPGPNGNKVPNNINPQSEWRLFDVEHGSHITVSDSSDGNILKVAYSLGKLWYE